MGDIYEHHLAPYTYWYDHPPLGWVQLAGYIWLTDGFVRYPSSIEVGREFMLLVTVASSVLIYVLCLRLGIRRSRPGSRSRSSGSPRSRCLPPPGLARQHRDALAAGRHGRRDLARRSLRAAFWAGVFSAVAVLSKETIAIAAGGVLADLAAVPPATRKWHVAVYPVTVTLITAFYPLFAVLRDELFPGSGHVSLLWAVWWQLLGRPAAGSCSPADPLPRPAALWLGTDRWLLLGGLTATPPGFFVRRLRPLALGFLLQTVMA